MRKRANQGKKSEGNSKRRSKYLNAIQHQREFAEKLKKRGGHWIQKIPGVMIK